MIVTRMCEPHCRCQQREGSREQGNQYRNQLRSAVHAVYLTQLCESVVSPNRRDLARFRTANRVRANAGACDDSPGVTSI